MGTTKLKLTLPLVFFVGCGDACGKTPGATSQPGASSSAVAAFSSAPAATASPTPVAPSARPKPLTLANMFDGAPDPAVKLVETKPRAHVSVGVPDGWEIEKLGKGVDRLQKKDKSAALVALERDVTEADLEADIASYVDAAFQATRVAWIPRRPASFGGSGREAVVSKGTGKVLGEDGDFWYVATAVSPERRYRLVVIAGAKKTATPATREEMVAAVRSIELVERK